MEKEIKKAKRFIRITFAVFCLLATGMVSLMIAYVTRPLDVYVTTEEIQREIGERNQGILIKTEDSYYEASASGTFAACFSFDQWKQTSAVPKGEPIVQIQFAELWVVELYADGQAAAYNGYAPMRCKSCAYYRIPEDALEKIRLYLKEKGIPHEAGDGTISAATFQH